MPDAPLTAIVVEDQPALRAMLSQLLFAPRGPFGGAGAFSDGSGVQRWLGAGGQAQVALVDLGLPDCSGVDVIAALRRGLPDIVCVAFTVFDDETSILGALRAGADGYLLKETPPARIIAALREAADGGAPLSATVARTIISAVRRGDLGAEVAGAPTLTTRERDVLILLAKGLSYDDIATALGIRLGTVQCHIKRVYTKLEVNTKAEAALVAARLGLA